MKKINLFLLAVISLVLSSCSLITNEENEAHTQGVLTLDINTSNSRTIGGYSSFTAADINNLEFKFYKETYIPEEQKTSFVFMENVVQAERPYSWYLPVDNIYRYRIEATGTVNGIPVYGSTEARMEPTGTHVKLIMSYKYDINPSETNDFRLTVNFDTAVVKELLAEKNVTPVPYTADYKKDGNKYYIDESVYFSASIRNKNPAGQNDILLWVSEEWTISDDNPQLKLILETPEQINTGFYELKINCCPAPEEDHLFSNIYYNLILKDSLIEVIPNNSIKEAAKVVTIDNEIQESGVYIYDLNIIFNIHDTEVSTIEKRFLYTGTKTVNLFDLLPSQYKNGYTISLNKESLGQYEEPINDGNNNWKFSYRSGSIVFEVVKNLTPPVETITDFPENLPVAYYHNSANNNKVLFRGSDGNIHSVESTEFYPAGNGDYYILNGNTIYLNEKAGASVESSDYFKIVDFIPYSNENKTCFYIVGQKNQYLGYNIYSINSDFDNKVSNNFTESVLSFNKDESSEQLFIAEINGTVYSMTKSGNRMCMHTDTEDKTLDNGSVSLALNNGSKNFYVSDFMAQGNILYTLVTYYTPVSSDKPEEHIIGGALLAFDTTQASDSSYKSKIIQENTDASVISNSTFLGPRKFLGTTSDAIYIADEGVYSSQQEWASRVLAYKYDVTSYTAFADPIVFSTDSDSPDGHFESYYKDSKYCVLPE